MEYYVTYKFNQHSCGWFSYKKCDDEKQCEKFIAKLKNMSLQEHCELFDIPPYKASQLEYSIIKYEPHSRKPKDDNMCDGPDEAEDKD